MSIEKLLWSSGATGLWRVVCHQLRGGAARKLVYAAIARARKGDEPEHQRDCHTALYDSARERMAPVDPAAPLAGVPFALKDLGSQSGRSRPITAAVCRHSRGISIPFLTERLRAAGT